MTKGSDETRQNSLARLFCFLLALLVVATSLITSSLVTSQILRPAYLGVMLGFFLIMGLREPGLRGQGWRFLLIGLCLLFGGSMAGSVLRGELFGGLSADSDLAWSLEHGVGFLLGFSVLSFGFLLWIPEIVRSRRLLEEGLDSVRQDQLKTSWLLRRSMRALERTHDELLQAERLAAVGELAAGVAHDLRNPLTVIRSAAQCLASGACPPAEAAEAAQAIQRGVDRADRTIRSLLEMGRPAEFQPRLLCAGQLIRETAALFAGEARRQGVALLEEAQAGHSLHADEGLLTRALSNLCRNALQATPSGGTVRIGSRSFRFNGNEVDVLFVEDTGHGIPSAIRPRLTTPFFSTRPGGTGLGLSVTQRVAARHRGRLALQPRARGGTRALLMLPAAPAPAGVA